MGAVASRILCVLVLPLMRRACASVPHAAGTVPVPQGTWHKSGTETLSNGTRTCKICRVRLG